VYRVWSLIKRGGLRGVQVGAPGWRWVDSGERRRAVSPPYGGWRRGVKRGLIRPDILHGLR